ncbi:hypothetical protein Tco_0672591, partial [Tanacetum coccineum]
ISFPLHCLCVFPASSTLHNTTWLQARCRAAMPRSELIITGSEENDEEGSDFNIA